MGEGVAGVPLIWSDFVWNFTSASNCDRPNPVCACASVCACVFYTVTACVCFSVRFSDPDTRSFWFTAPRRWEAKTERWRKDRREWEGEEREMSKDGGRFGGKSEGNKDTGEGWSLVYCLAMQEIMTELRGKVFHITPNQTALSTDTEATIQLSPVMECS